MMVVDVMLDPVADKLLAATHGRGMYVAPVLPPRTTRTLGRHEERTRRWDGDERPGRDRLRPDLCLRLRPGHASSPSTAVPASGSVFSGWSGVCSGTGTCQLTMSADHSVTALFALVAPEDTDREQGGRRDRNRHVQPRRDRLRPDLRARFEHGTSVTLTATAGIGSTFTGWSGACSGAGHVHAHDEREPVGNGDVRGAPASRLSVDKTGSGAGTISSSPAGIDCGATCAHDFLYGTEVTLTAVPAAGSSFTGWSGGCSGIDPCRLTMFGRALGDRGLRRQSRPAPAGVRRSPAEAQARSLQRSA